MSRIVALIPAHNEAERIAATVSAAHTIPHLAEVVVIDDGSTDDTAFRAASAGATQVIRVPDNIGKGGALDAGLASLGEPSPEITLLLDADLGETSSQGALLLEPVLTGAADMAIARFPRPSRRAGFGLVMGLARWGIRRLGGPFDAHAPLSGQRALNRAAIDACSPFAGGFGVEVALTIRALRAGLRVTEVETTMAHSATGRDLAGFVHRGRQFIHVARTLIALAFERRSGSSG